jgi:hypothetical protein
MFGFIFGTLCVIGLVRLGGGHRQCRDEAGWRPRGTRRRRGRGEGGRRRGMWSRAAAEVFKRRVDVDDDQADLIDHAVSDIHRAVSTFKGDLKGQHGELAEIFSAESLDEAAVEVLFEQQDQALSRARRQVLSALKQVHGVLDEEQRGLASELLSGNPMRWR